MTRPGIHAGFADREEAAFIQRVLQPAVNGGPIQFLIGQPEGGHYGPGTSLRQNACFV
jgi:hypothetical protein